MSASVRSQPLLAVRDVRSSSRWYATLPNLVDPDSGRNGHGVLVWFEVDDLDAAIARARALGAAIVEDVHVNPAPRHREMWLRDPDGYLVVICSPDGEADRLR